MKDINEILSRGEFVRNSLKQMLSEKRHTSEDKINLLAAYTAVALEHHKSIHLLIKQNLCGSAFALVRPLFEVFSRANWVYVCATKEQAHEIWNNDSFQFPGASDMVKSIDKKYPSEKFFTNGIKKRKSTDAP